jgi:hypothetical protein
VPGTTTGPGPITVTKSGASTQSTDTFARYSIAPTSGPTGTLVTVNGAGFSNSSTVKFGDDEVPFTPAADHLSLTLNVPDGAMDGDVSVDGVGLPFDVTLSVTAVDHSSGVVGDPVVISGVGFADGATVSFGDTAASDVHVDSDTQITATVPAGASTGAVSVTTAAGTAQSAEVFEIDAPAPATDDSPQFAAAGAR